MNTYQYAEQIRARYGDNSPMPITASEYIEMVNDLREAREQAQMFNDLLETLEAGGAMLDALRAAVVETYDPNSRTVAEVLECADWRDEMDTRESNRPY